MAIAILILVGMFLYFGIGAYCLWDGILGVLEWRTYVNKARKVRRGLLGARVDISAVEFGDVASIVFGLAFITVGCVGVSLNFMKLGEIFKSLA